MPDIGEITMATKVSDIISKMKIDIYVKEPFGYNTTLAQRQWCIINTKSGLGILNISC